MLLPHTLLPCLVILNISPKTIPATGRRGNRRTCYHGLMLFSWAKWKAKLSLHWKRSYKVLKTGLWWKIMSLSGVDNATIFRVNNKEVILLPLKKNKPILGPMVGCILEPQELFPSTCSCLHQVCSVGVGEDLSKKTLHSRWSVRYLQTNFLHRRP